MGKDEIQKYNTIRKIASECVVLLKSDGSFPIIGKSNLALFGAGVRHTLRGGTGGGIVEVRSFTSIEQGLVNAGFNIVSNVWLDGYDVFLEKAKSERELSIKVKLATDGLTALGALSIPIKEPEYSLPLEYDADTAIYVLSRLSGEGADRDAIEGDIFLTKTEIRDICTLSRIYPRFMLVLNVSGVVDLSPIVDKVKNILLLSQLGSAIGDTFADIICGKAYPSGKLASTWAAYADYQRIGDWNPQDDTRYREGIYVGYRYFDSTGKNPLFPFGFGLSYTRFALVPKIPIINKSKVTIPVEVRNYGHYSGKEVVQVYVSLPQGKLDQPHQVLAAFEKTKELKTGEAQTLNITFDITELLSFDSEICARILQSGDYVLRVGNSSRNTKAVGIVRLDKTTIVERVSHVGGSPDFTDFRPKILFVEDNSNLPVLALSSADIEPITHKQAQIDKKALDFAQGLSDEKLCYFCTGNFDEGGQERGLGGATVPGAAGQTTLLFDNDCIDTLIMADGPAGLHISGQYGVDEKGKYAVVSEETKAIKRLLPPDVLKYLLVMFPDAANEDRCGEIHDQYCTALPIETALAQSWNPEICRTCGDLVAKEMEEYGVDFNLAPALNMHRHPLCGRNFEYFSEDPLITGKMAAAIVDGVQSHKGRGSMLKHFVCNEQETNRLNSNSIISERALRDIYLRSFEIAVKEATPFAVMTSYNLVNGIHTSERTDLIAGVLREEWGFDGIVVSDWVGFKPQSEDRLKHPRARASKTLAAENDLMMPGSKGHYDEILGALKSGELNRMTLENCAARMIAVTKKLKGAD